jgi:hypothetical protein
VAEGLGFNPKRRGVREDHARVHHVHPGFFGRDDKWGPSVSGWRQEKRYRFGREGERAVGRIQSRAKVLPRGLLTFSYFLSLSFLFSFEFLFESLQITSDLKLGHNLIFVKLSF